MSKRASFFATRSDLAALLAAVDAKINLQFVKAGRAEQMWAPATFSVEGVPDLGFASANSSSLCTGYLLTEIGVSIVARELASAPRFAFDQLANPKSAVFRPGGLWKKT